MTLAVKLKGVLKSIYINLEKLFKGLFVDNQILFYLKLSELPYDLKLKRVTIFNLWSWGYPIIMLKLMLC